MELQKEAVSCGVDSRSYWSMTPREIRAAIDGYSLQSKTDFESKIALYNHVAWLSGMYFGIAHNNPKLYPEKPLELKEKKPEQMTDDAMEAWARSFAKRNSS